MSERSTGATDEKIEAAAERAWRLAAESNRDVQWPYPPDGQYGFIITDGQNEARQDASHWASIIVPPDQRIVPASFVVAVKKLESAASALVGTPTSETHGIKYGFGVVRECLDQLRRDDVAIIPVSPVRADREAVARVICSQVYESDGVSTRCFMAADAVIAILRATPEPERAG